MLMHRCDSMVGVLGQYEQYHPDTGELLVGLLVRVRVRVSMQCWSTWIAFNLGYPFVAILALAKFITSS